MNAYFTKEQKVIIAKVITMTLSEHIVIRPQRLGGYCNDVLEDINNGALESKAIDFDNKLNNL